jgi:hypothetical protein
MNFSQLQIQIDKSFRKHSFCLTLLLAFLPLLCFANAGSPMMYFGLLHCVILNAVIGVVESLILKRFQFQNRMWLIIVANYISACIGLYFIAPYFSTLTGNNIFWWGGKTEPNHPYHLTGFFVGMLTSFAATLIIEYPFFSLALKDKSQRSKLLTPFLIANAVTNILMTLVYLWIILSEKPRLH